MPNVAFTASLEDLPFWPADAASMNQASFFFFCKEAEEEEY
jgi:hypothetical protein